MCQKLSGESTIAIYSFDPNDQKFVSIDAVPDFRTEAEKTLTSHAIYNHDKPDIGYVERLAEEFINVSGAGVRVYLKQTDVSEGVDNDFDEDAHAVFSNPILLKAYFKPEPKTIELKKFGVDTTTQITLVFHRATLLLNPLIGDRLIVPGDLIRVPYNSIDERTQGPMVIRVHNATPLGNYHYRFIYHQVTGEPISGDELAGPAHE